MKLVETSIINGDCEEIGTVMTVYNYEYGVGVTVEYQNTTDYDADAGWNVFDTIGVYSGSCHFDTLEEAIEYAKKLSQDYIDGKEEINEEYDY